MQRQVTSTLSDAKVNKGTCAEEGENLANLNMDITGTLPASISFFFSKTENKVVLMDVLVKFDPDDIFKNNDKGFNLTFYAFYDFYCLRHKFKKVVFH